MMRINLSLLFSLALVFFACSPGEKKGTDAVIENDSPAIVLVDADDSRIRDRHYEKFPAIGAAADGSAIYVAWYSGGQAPGPGNFVTVSVSLDQGKSWLSDQLVVFPKEPSNRIFDPALWRDEDGQVHLFYGSTKDSLLWDGYGGVNTLPIGWKNGMITHGESYRLSDGVMSNKPIVVDGKEAILFPIYIDKPNEGSEGKSYPSNGAFVLSHPFNIENGVIKELESYSSISIPEDLRIHDEPQLVQVSNDGSFLALVRTTEGIYFSKSSDYGKTWTDVAPFTAAGPTTSSRFYIGKLKSGNLILVMNASTTRNNMAAFISEDGGESWPHKLLLDARENVSYPDLDQTEDGTIHVVFDRDRTGAKDILYARFNEKDVIENLSDNIFKTRVNRP
jgi:predicted neuraminidase